MPASCAPPGAPALRSSAPGSSASGAGRFFRCSPATCLLTGACCRSTSGCWRWPSEARMNILFLDQFSEMGGAQRCLRDLLPAVAARGWTAHVAAPGKGPPGTHSLPLSPYGAGRKSLGDLVRFASDLRAVPDAIESLARE